MAGQRQQDDNDEGQRQGDDDEEEGDAKEADDGNDQGDDNRERGRGREGARNDEHPPANATTRPPSRVRGGALAFKLDTIM